METVNLEDKLTTIKKAPLFQWDYLTVTLWIETLKLNQDIKINVKSISMCQYINGSQLKKAKDTPQMMMKLFNKSFQHSYFSLTHPITLDTATDLCKAVKKLIYDFNDQLIKKQALLDAANSPTANKLKQNMIQNQCEATPPPPPTPTPKWQIKHIKEWNINDTKKWIKSLNINTNKKKIIMNAFYKGNRDGQYLDNITCGMEIANDDTLITHTITPPVAKLVYDELENIRKTKKKQSNKKRRSARIANKKKMQIKDEDNDYQMVDYPPKDDDNNIINKKKRKIAIVNWKDEQVEDWSNKDLKDWIKSLDIKKKDMKKIIYNIDTGKCTGYDFKEMRNGKEIAESFDMMDSVTLCNYIYDQLRSRIFDKKNKSGGIKAPTNSYDNLYGNSITDDIMDVCESKDNDNNNNNNNDNNNNNNNNINNINSHVPNNGWKTKNIDDWTCEELQGWIFNLQHLGIVVQIQIMEEIRNAEMTGEDFNGCTTADDITESFDTITKTIGNKMYKSLEKMRNKRGKNNKNNNNNNNNRYNNNRYSNEYNNNQYNYNQCSGGNNLYNNNNNYEIWKPLTDPSSGIIGLINGGNTCFINCVIQCLLQTPPLIKILRTWNSIKQQRYNYSSMLDSFIGVAKRAMKHDAKYTAVNPAMIVSNLRSSDVKFERGAQGDALSAISKMIELLDIDIIARQKLSGVSPVYKVINHPGSWDMRCVLDKDSEDDDIDGHLLNYNPYKSVIRESIHFVERNVLSCMNPKCNYQESRYDIKEKILLPLYDHSMDIIIDIYIPINNQYIQGKPCNVFKVLDYCSIDTLKYQIFNTLINELNKNKNNRIKLMSVEQIKLKTIEANISRYFSDWITDIKTQNECTVFRKQNMQIIAVVEPFREQNMQNNNSVNATTFNIYINEYGKVDTSQFSLLCEQIPNGKKLLNNMSNHNYKQYWYVNEKLIEMNGNHQQQFIEISDHHVIICLWIHVNVKQGFFKDYNNKDFDNTNNEMWKFLLYNKCQNFVDYGKCYNELVKIQNRECRPYMESGYATNDFGGKWMKLLQKSIDYFKALRSNQSQVYKWAECVFKNKTRHNKHNNVNGIVQTDICSAFDVYKSDKILDRGAVLKCGNCHKKSEVFKSETAIVRYPEILIFTIDRYNDGRKFDNRVNYPHVLKYDTGYELYAVCNHSGNLNGGHYWAYVKGIDDNNWYDANDNNIHKINPNNVINQASAIILMYKKIKK